eukprot:3900328-Alexandrium_andersonii.AAC.1
MAHHRALRGALCRRTATPPTQQHTLWLEGATIPAQTPLISAVYVQEAPFDGVQEGAAHPAAKTGSVRAGASRAG